MRRTYKYWIERLLFIRWNRLRQRRRERSFTRTRLWFVMVGDDD